MAPKALLDTNILSAVVADDPRLSGRDSLYRRTHRRLTVSGITRYEIGRGLHAKQAGVQFQAFQRFCASLEILPVDDNVLHRAAEVWGILRLRGVQIADADCLIAATALVHGLVLVTNNTKDFGRVPGLSLDNWLA